MTGKELLEKTAAAREAGGKLFADINATASTKFSVVPEHITKSDSRTMRVGFTVNEVEYRSETSWEKNRGGKKTTVKGNYVGVYGTVEGQLVAFFGNYEAGKEPVVGSQMVGYVCKIKKDEVVGHVNKEGKLEARKALRDGFVGLPKLGFWEADGSKPAVDDSRLAVLEAAVQEIAKSVQTLASEMKEVKASKARVSL